MKAATFLAVLFTAPLLVLSLFGGNVLANKQPASLPTERKVTHADGSGETLDSYNFHGNSRVMFDKILDGTPWVFRGKARSNILRELGVMGGKDVTEAMAYEVIHIITPKMFIKNSLKILDELALDKKSEL